ATLARLVAALFAVVMSGGVALGQTWFVTSPSVVKTDAVGSPRTVGTGTLFATDGNQGSGSNLITVNTTTGAGTVIGPMGGFPMPALARDPLTGTLYAGQGQGGPNLYTVNTGTGAVNLVGSTGFGFAAIADMDFRADGTLFATVNKVGAATTGAETLATIN